MVEPPASPTVAALEATLTQVLLEGDGLRQVRLGALREQVAQPLGLPRDGLGGRSDEVPPEMLSSQLAPGSTKPI